MAEIEIGRGKSARRGYGFDEIAVVPSRRTRDGADVDIGWQIDAYRFELPVVAAAMDSVTSPRTAITMGRLGGVGVLDLEGVWTRYRDADTILAEISALDPDSATARLREIYSAPIDPDLIGERISEVAAAGVRSAARTRPQRAAELAPHAIAADVDLLVIQGRVVSAEHVSSLAEPLNLKTFIRDLEVPVLVGGCVSYQAALHLMRTGAAGILVGAGTGRVGTGRQVLGFGAPPATAVADARAARMRHLDETGVYCHLIADGGMRTAGDVAKAMVCGADAVMLGMPLAAASDAPAPGRHWDLSAAHPSLPRSRMIPIDPRGTLERILLGPATDGAGTTNLMGGLRTSMATCGYTDVKDFQKAELVVTSGSDRRGPWRAGRGRT
ncbi:MAG: GuaB3 family IMP dehydrogenase-related protein [Acidimicrobiales bacterium]